MGRDFTNGRGLVTEDTLFLDEMRAYAAALAKFEGFEELSADILRLVNMASPLYELSTPLTRSEPDAPAGAVVVALSAV